MQHAQLYSLIQRLYMGLPNGSEDILDNSVSFRDPVVIVKGRVAVLAMFQKINRMFPHTHIEQLQQREEQDGASRWYLTVQYGTRASGKTRAFRTELNIEYTFDGRITRITEHWLWPIKMRGNGQNRLLRTNDD